MTRKQLLLCLLVSLFGIFVSVNAMADPVFSPANKQPIVDAADILTPQEETTLNSEIKAIVRQSHYRFGFLIVPDLQGYDIVDFGTKAARYYRVGDKDADDGILITIAMKENKTRVDVAKGMESLVTDVTARQIRRSMNPYFRKQDWSGGIRQGISVITSAITPKSPEQIAIDQRAKIQRQQREAQDRDNFLNFLSVFGIVSGIAATGGGAYMFATRDKRRQRREAREAYERKLAEDRAAARAEAYRLAAERQATADKKRKDMLDAMTPSERARFLHEEELRRKADELAAQKRREQEEAEEEETRRQQARYDSYASSPIQDDWNYNSSSDTDSSSSSSDNTDYFGGGADYGGGGSDGGWND